MISTNLLVGIEFVAIFGAILWFAWSQARTMERSLAEDRRKAEESRASDAP